MTKKSVANIDKQGHTRSAHRSSLVSKPGFTHDRQPQGASINVGGKQLHKKPTGYARAAHQCDLIDHHKRG